MQIVIGLIAGAALLYKFGQVDEKSVSKKDKDTHKQEAEEEKRMEKYVRHLDSSSVKDFQSIIKKIDDEEEIKKVIAYLKNRSSKIN